MSNTRSINMTSGSLWKNIFFFSIPLMFSQILEVLFNLSDVAIAGKFAGYHALGSVGSTTLLVSLFTGFLLGMGSGVNVRTAHELGVGDREAISNTIHTSLILCTGKQHCRPLHFLLHRRRGGSGPAAVPNGAEYLWHYRCAAAYRFDPALCEPRRFFHDLLLGSAGLY